MVRVADIVAQTLARHGAHLAFGMPGGEVLTLVDAMNSAAVKFVLARHETAAAMMAAGASVSSGTIGVLVTTLGPGLANAVNGIADASQEHVPLIVIAGVVDHAIRSRYTHQIIDQKAMLTGLVKGSFEVEVEGAGGTVARAIALAMAEPKGPVLIELAPGTAAQPAHVDDRPCSPPRILKARLSSDDPAVTPIAEALRSAARPLILAGFEAAQGGAGPAIVRVAEALGCPVITTYKGKGVIPESHALALGGAGLSPLAEKYLLPLVKQADVVLLAGFDPIELRPGWIEPFGPNAEVIEVTAQAPDHGMYSVTLRIAAEVRPAMETLADALAAGSPRPPRAELAVAKSALATAFAIPPEWGPHKAIATLQDTMPADATVTVDSGAHRILLSQMMRFERPLALLQSAGFCTMGAAIPLALGVKSCDRGRPVIAVLGDGGLEMGIGELATARDEELAIVIVVFQDESLALIELKQRQANLADAGVKLGRTRYEDVAEAFGGVGTRVASADAFRGELHKALKRDTFTVIVCEIEASQYAGRI